MPGQLPMGLCRPQVVRGVAHLAAACRRCSGNCVLPWNVNNVWGRRERMPYLRAAEAALQ